MYIFMKVFLRQIYSYNFHFSKLNNLKVIHDLYFQYLTQILSKITSKSYSLRDAKGRRSGRWEDCTKEAV